jgi:hypothetical protein
VLRARAGRIGHTVIVAMHPVGSPGYLPLFSELARTGLHVIGCGNRYALGDAALQMENVQLDLGACIRDARDRLGYQKVVLGQVGLLDEKVDEVVDRRCARRIHRHPAPNPVPP